MTPSYLVPKFYAAAPALLVRCVARLMSCCSWDVCFVHGLPRVRRRRTWFDPVTVSTKLFPLHTDAGRRGAREDYHYDRDDRLSERGRSGVKTH
jgi:hypothetical protein